MYQRIKGHFYHLTKREKDPNPGLSGLLFPGSEVSVNQEIKYVLMKPFLSVNS